MFTGLVQAVGEVAEIDGSNLALRCAWPGPDDPIRAGESVAVNGCCLTALADGELRFELSPETRRRTAFHGLRAGMKVNLERALRPLDRLGGHFVQGHVDAVGELVTMLQSGEFTVFRFRAPEEYDRYLIDKGSITIDGISLTVVNPIAGEFDAWVVPHTMAATNLADRVPGDSVNLEFDILAKHVEKLLTTD